MYPYSINAAASQETRARSKKKQTPPLWTSSTKDKAVDAMAGRLLKLEQEQLAFKKQKWQDRLWLKKERLCVDAQSPQIRHEEIKQRSDKLSAILQILNYYNKRSGN